MAYGSVKMCLQCATCSMVSTCLFRALKFLSCRDSRVKEEACRWPQGKTLRLEIPGVRFFRQYFCALHRQKALSPPLEAFLSLLQEQAAAKRGPR